VVSAEDHVASFLALESESDLLQNALQLDGRKGPPAASSAGASFALNVLQRIFEEHAQNGAAVRSGNPRVSGPFGGADGALCAKAKC